MLKATIPNVMKWDGRMHKRYAFLRDGGTNAATQQHKK